MAVLPTTGISTNLVKTAIGAGSNDVGTLCTHPNVNKWSKWKPVRRNSVAGLIENDLRLANWGIDVPVFSSMSSLINYYKDNPISWSYLKPRGGAFNEFYRLGDFRTYEHTAVLPYYYSVMPNQVSNAAGAAVTTWLNTIIRAYNLSVFDFNEIVLMSTKYYGICLVQQSNYSNYKYKTTVSSIVDGTTADENSVILPVAGYTIGNYDVYVFITDTIRTDPDSSITGGNFVCLAKTTIEVIEDIPANDLNITPLTSFTEPSTANYKFTLVSNSGNNLTLYNVRVGYRYGDNQPSDTFEVGEAYMDYGTVQVNPSVILQDTFVDVGADKNTRGHYIFLRYTYLSETKTEIFPFYSPD